MEYNMKWDTYITCVTVLVSILIAASACMIVKIQLESALWILTPISLVLFIVFLYMPYKVGYNDRSIYIQRIKGKVEIPLVSILSIEPINQDTIQNSVRIFGSGGFLGNIGYFRNGKLGTYIMYTTSTKNMVCIKTDTKKYVINCPDSILGKIAGCGV